MYDEWLNMLVGGSWYDRAEYRNLVAGHITGQTLIKPAQWRGWPRLVCDNQGWRYEGVWVMPCMAERLLNTIPGRYQDIDPDAVEEERGEICIIHFSDGSRFYIDPDEGREWIDRPRSTPENDMWRVDVAGYPCYVKGKSAYEHLEYINREYGRLKMLEFKLRHLLKDENNASK